eukprot:Gb_03119 [translate_table: standard]
MDTIGGSTSIEIFTLKYKKVKHTIARRKAEKALEDMFCPRSMGFHCPLEFSHLEAHHLGSRNLPFGFITFHTFIRCLALKEDLHMLVSSSLVVVLLPLVSSILSFS